MTPIIVQYKGLNWKDVLRASVKINQKQPIIPHILLVPYNIQYADFKVPEQESYAWDMNYKTPASDFVGMTKFAFCIKIRMGCSLVGQLEKSVYNNSYMQNIQKTKQKVQLCKVRKSLVFQTWVFKNLKSIPNQLTYDATQPNIIIETRRFNF